jgi:hypothetical protein
MPRTRQLSPVSCRSPYASIATHGSTSDQNILGVAGEIRKMQLLHCSALAHPFEALKLLWVAYNKRSTQTLMHFDQPGSESARDTDLVATRIELYFQLESDPF